MAEFCVWCRHGVLSRRNKATSASDRRPSASWVLFRAGKLIQYLHGSYFLPYHSADGFRFCFIHHFSVTRLGCSLNALSFISWVDTPLTADWLQVCFGTLPTQFSKAFWKITYPTFKCILSHYMCTAPEQPLQAGQGMVKNTALDTVQSRHTLVKLSGLWRSIVLQHGADPLVWVHSKLSE